MENCDHDWNYTCLGMYRHCRKCHRIEGNHVKYGWVEFLFRNDEAYAFKRLDGEIEMLEEIEQVKCDKKKVGR